jgi:hypothetical protein
LFDKHEIADMFGVSAGTSAPSATTSESDFHKKPGWIQLPQPDAVEKGQHGSGYYVYGTGKGDKPGTRPSGQWGEPRTMETIAAVADKLSTGKQFTPFGVGNISLADGGKFDPHKTHVNGLGIDVRPARLDGAQQGSSYKSNTYTKLRRSA